MANQFVVSMLMLHFGTPRDQQAREQLAAALPADAQVTEPDKLGIFDVHVTPMTSSRRSTSSGTRSP